MNQPAARQEQTFLAEGGIVVTNTRFAVKSQTYSVANITSVKHAPAKRAGGIAMAVIGVLLLIGGAPPVVGMLFLVVGALMIFLAPSAVALATAGGDVKALASRDHKLIGRVVQALNEAIIHRG